MSRRAGSTRIWILARPWSAVDRLDRLVIQKPTVMQRPQERDSLVKNDLRMADQMKSDQI